MKQKVWFITGASRGFGRIWAEAALKRGDKVAVTARTIDTVKELEDKYGDHAFALELNVNNREECFEAIKKAHEHFGRLDVVINNAGYGQFGMLEELTEEEVRQQFETNVFGAVWVTQAVLPFMRKQQGGHILQVSSIGGVLAFENIGIYNASKFALEALSDALSKEVAGFGIYITLIEPGGYGTDWGGSSAKRATTIADYDQVREARAKLRGTWKPGVPEATAGAILKAVDADKPPLRIILGEQPIEWIKQEYEKRMENWEQWQSVSAAAQGEK